MPRIQANRDQVDDRFSVLGFTIRTESPLFEVAVATDPALFRADARGRRGRRNFYSSRAQGVLRARRGEAVYLLPQDVLANFVGQPKLYFGLATYKDGTPQQPDFVQLPQSGNMYVSLSGLSERGLRRSVGAFNGSSYGQAATGRDPSLEWGGDSTAARPATAPAPAAAPSAARPAAANGAAAPAGTATPVAAGLDYDDGFGPFPAAQSHEGVQAYRQKDTGEQPASQSPDTQAMDIPLDPGAGGRSIGLDALQAGDIIVSTTRAWVSRAIRLGTLSPVSHVMLYLGGGRVIEAVGSGVREVQLEAAIADAILAVAYRVPNLSAAQRDRVLHEARQFKDQPYNYPGIVQRGVAIVAPVTGAVVDAISRLLSVPRQQAHAVYCSQLVLEAYQRAGITLLSSPASQSTPEAVARFAQGRLGYVGHLKAEDVPLGIQFALDEDSPEAGAPYAAQKPEQRTEQAVQPQSWVEPQEVLLKAYNGTLGDQIRLFADTVRWIAGVDDTRALPHSAICQVLCYNGERMIGKATAFFIAQRLLLTNAHVVNGCTKLVIIPGKVGDGAGSEPFGRFETTTWRAHPSYSRGSRDFDFAVVLAPRNAPGGFLSPVEELTQSRPEGVAVCGYSARSRRDDPVGTIVNAVLNPDKQHVHRGYVREITDEVMHYDVQELAGSSGSPVYWIEGGAFPRVHVVGVNAGPRDGTTNSGVRLTRAKVQWIRDRARDMGVSVSFEAEGGEEPNHVSEAQSAEALIIDSDDVTRLQRHLPAWRDLYTWTAPGSLTAPLAARNMRIQRFADAHGALNLDRYEVRISRLPSGATPESLVAEIRKNINQYVDTRNSEFIPYDASDATLWSSNSPFGAVLKIDILGPDNASVVCSLAEARRWRFTTIHAPWSGDHPVSGHREFGIRPDGDGFIFFTRAADRATDGIAETVVWAGANHLWQSLQRKVTDYVNSHGGAASILPHFSERFHPRVAAILAQEVIEAQSLAAQEPAAAAQPQRELHLAPPPAPQMQQPLGWDEAQAAPAAAVEIASAIAGAAMERLSSNQGDINVELDQLRGLKHPNDQAPANPAPFQDAPVIRLTGWPKVSNYLGDEISAGFEIRWQFNGRSLGNVQIALSRSNDAVGWGLQVHARIMDDAIVYPRQSPSFAAIRVRFDYRFTRAVGSDVLAHQEVHLFGNGRHNISGEWTQASTFSLAVEEEDPRLLQAQMPAQELSGALAFTARTATPTAPSQTLRNALGATSGMRKALLEVAARELGVREEANPRAGESGQDPTINSDSEGRIVMYLQECGVGAAQGQANPAYCAAFATTMLRQAGYRGVNGSASASRLRQQFESAGKFQLLDASRPYDPARDYRAQPGDLYFKGAHGHETHVGIVVAVEDNGTLHTIEGNTWGAGGPAQSGVMERTIRPSHGQQRAAIAGFGVLS